MKSIPYEAQLVLARCDLERVVRQYLDAGVEPRRLAEELLDICARLHQVNRIAAEYGTVRAESSHDDRHVGPADASISLTDATDAPGKIRWLRKVDEVLHGSGKPPGVGPRPDHRQGLPDR